MELFIEQKVDHENRPQIPTNSYGITIGHNVWVDSTSDNPLHEHEQVHINQLLNYEGGWAKYYMDYLYYFLHYGSGYEHPLETPAYEHQIEYSKTHSIAIF